MAPSIGLSIRALPATWSPQIHWPQGQVTIPSIPQTPNTQKPLFIPLIKQSHLLARISHLQGAHAARRKLSSHPSGRTEACGPPRGVFSWLRQISQQDNTSKLHLLVMNIEILCQLQPNLCPFQLIYWLGQHLEGWEKRQS